ncbi:MAG: serine/threonine-protein kinase, partial [Actinoplanes sp.]
MTDPLRPGDPSEVGGYRLLGRLGQGGMGSVYLGRNPAGRLVAVKVIRPEYAYDQEFRARFRSEVSRAREVPPFCTAEVLDADPDHPTPYLVVEYVDGPSLAQVVAENGPLQATNLHSVAIGVATALAAIHGAGVIHRDLKPANVLFALGTPKVIDFGIARAFEATSRHTRTDQMVGTVAYMAPERFDDDSGPGVGPAADVFAWGAVIGYAGTGRTPFQADSAAATAGRILTQPPDLTGLPDSLRPVVARTLSKDPADRPTAHELLDLLLAAEPSGAGTLIRQPELRRAAEAARRTGPPARARGRRLLLAALAVVVLAAVGLLTAPFTGFSAGSDQVEKKESPATTPSTAGRRVVQGPSIIDRLDRPGQWAASGDDNGACAFARGRLEVTTGDSNEYRCRGPEDIFAGDQSIAVRAVVLTPGACAAIWLRSVDVAAYRVALCEKDVRIGLDNDGDLTGEV